MKRNMLELKEAGETAVITYEALQEFKEYVSKAMDWVEERDYMVTDTGAFYRIELLEDGGIV